MSGSDTSEPLSQYYLQSWRKIGLDAQLVDGRLHEFNSFYNMIEKDDPKVDVFAGTWGSGYDPDPSWLWLKDAQYNFIRWVNPDYFLWFASPSLIELISPLVQLKRYFLSSSRLFNLRIRLVQY